MKLEQETRTKIDKEIDAALKVLSGAQPPAAMVSRIQQSLEAAAAGLQHAGSGRMFWIPAASMAIAALVSIGIFSQGRWAGRKQRPLGETAKMIVPAPASEPTAAAQPLVAQAQTSQRKPAALAAVQRRRREHPQDRHVANLMSYPLTREEKLLVRFAQTASPAELQMLNPDYQAKVEAQQEAEFEATMKSTEDSGNYFTSNAEVEANSEIKTTQE